jgi:hypothetical protein
VVEDGQAGLGQVAQPLQHHRVGIRFEAVVPGIDVARVGQVGFPLGEPRLQLVEMNLLENT